MKQIALLLLSALSASALSHEHVSGHEYNLMKRHRQMAARAVPPRPKVQRRAGPRRMNSKRKVLGEGDSSSAPSNIAKGTATAADGCAVWHTVLDGEVCLGLIDKSSAGFTLEKFLQMNPSLNDQCSNLVTDLAYCVDTAAGKTPSKAIAAEAAVPTTAARVAAVNASSKADDDEEDLDCDDSDDDASASASASDEGTDTEDCDDVEEDESGADEEDCDEDEEADNSASNSDTAAAVVSVKLAPTTSSSAPKPKATQSDSNDGSSTDGSSDSASDSSRKDDSASSANLDQSGTATWYTQNGNPGNCGDYSQDSDYVVALYTPQYDNGSHCGKKVRLVNKANGNSAIATVKDSCPSCERNGNIDCSTALFNDLSDNNPGLGVLDVEWGFI